MRESPSSDVSAGAGARVALIQPPFVQLNGPYPSIYYLRSFLSAQGVSVETMDHSIGLFEGLFSREGMRRVFGDARGPVEAWLAQPPSRGAFPVDGLERPCSPEEVAVARRELARYLSNEDRWIGAIDRVISFLRGRDREFAYLLAAANGALPMGARTEAIIGRAEGEPGVDQGPAIATAMVSDLADLIRVTLDPAFSLVRYGSSLASSVGDFSEAARGAEGWTLRSLYAPLLDEEWQRLERIFAPTTDSPFYLAITIPFPGTLAGALFAARSAKHHFGGRVRVIAGGGYVNTELRELRDGALFDYFDFLSFDRGYGSLLAILGDGETVRASGLPLYKTMYRREEGIVGSPDVAALATPQESERLRVYHELDMISARGVFPDYGDLDFTRYILPVDDENPMHRLWSDGRWLKAYLAHGCYWHGCAFCDVELDYVKGYAPVDAGSLFQHLLIQGENTGVRGVHLCDEAAPPASLLRLAELNRAAGLPLSFWGNIRFEKTFDADAARILGAGGFLAASGGIEVASERGFARIGKGISLPEVVATCAAFKEAGILVHAYLIYGFWDEDPSELMDSLETMRQLFAAGLVDSAFWHKFVLTRHSKIFAEWRGGMHPGLCPLWPDGKPVAPDGSGNPATFASNDLRFQGEERLDPFGTYLDGALGAWMSGASLDKPIRSLFPFTVPQPRVAPDRVARLLDTYARDRDRKRSSIPPTGSTERYVFLGSAPVLSAATEERESGGRRVSRPSRRTSGFQLSWQDRGSPFSLFFASEADARRLGSALREAARGEVSADEILSALAAAGGARGGAPAGTAWATLRAGGLCLRRKAPAVVPRG